MTQRQVQTRTAGHQLLDTLILADLPAIVASDVGAQPVDSDLTAIAALTTTSFGRSRLVEADAAAARTALALGSLATASSLAHSATTGQTTDDHHAKSHTHNADGSGTVPYSAVSGTPAAERAAASTTPAAVGTAAVGSGTTDARADHVHATGAGTPTSSAVGDAAATGAGPAAAMTNHVHGREAFGTTAAAVGTSAGGSATTPSKSDHVHATGAGTPSTQAFGDAAATGSGPAAAMTDHKHAMPGNTGMAFIGGGTRFYPSISSGVYNNQVATLNTLFAAPFYVPVSTAFDRIAIVCASLVALSVARLGIYNDGGGKPTTLVVDAGTVDTHTAGGTLTITISQTLAAGWYWLACAGQTAAPNLGHATGAAPAFSGIGNTSPFGLAFPAGFSQTGISGALPSPWGSTLTEIIRTPIVWLRAT